MKLSDRIGILLRADAHGVVESLEDRSLLLKQYVREAEIDLSRKRARLEALREESKRLAAARLACEAEMRALDEDISLALQGGKEDLARFAIRRLLPRRAEMERLRTQIGQRACEEGALAERVALQESQLDALRNRVRMETAQPCTDSAMPCGLQDVVADEAVELELLRRRQAAGGKP